MNVGRGHGWDFRLIVEAVSDAIVAADTTNRVVYANRAIEDLLQWRPEDLVGNPLTTIVPERLRAKHVEAFERFIATGEANLIGHATRLPALRADGSEVDIELTLNAFVLPDGYRLIVGSLRDVTERIVLERRSIVAQELLKVISEATSLAETNRRILQTICRALTWDAAAIWVVDRQADLLRCLDFWGVADLDLTSFEHATRSMVFSSGSGLPGRVWGAKRAAWISDIFEETNFPRFPHASSSGLRAGFCFPIMAAGDVLGVIELFHREPRVPDEDLLETMGAVGKRLGGFLERRRAEEEIGFQRSLLAAESEASLDGMVVVSPEGKISYFNRRFVQMWDMPEDVMASRSERRILRQMLNKAADPRTFLARVGEIRADPARASRDAVELEDRRVFDRYTAPLGSGDGRSYGRVWYFRDVTPQKRAERELEASRQKFANIARALQQSLLPAALPDIPGFDLAASYRPAGAGVDVGGDFYDVFTTASDEWAAMVGDVSGKGPQAAGITSLLRHTARAAALRMRQPARILREVNEAMRRHELGERFCTAAYVRLTRTGGHATVVVASAGHPRPYLVTSSGDPVPVGTAGTALGVVDDLVVEQESVTLEPGATLVLYTDGVLDAGAPHAELGEAGLSALLTEFAAGSAADIVTAIDSAVLERENGRPRDDVAILVLRREPRA